MIQFPETADSEWKIAAEAAGAEDNLKARLKHDSDVEAETSKLRVRHEANLRLQRELAAEETPTLVMGSITDFVQMNNGAAPVDLIEGVMKADSMTGVLGPSGAGKTTTALQMIHSLMTGTLWLGQPVKQITGSVGILSYDQNAALMQNWIIATGLDPARVFMVDAHGKGNPLMVPEYRSQIARAMKARGVEIVLVDSFSASFAGNDQNDSTQTMAYYSDMKKFVLSEVGATSTLMILHATKAKPNEPRGASAHIDVADSIVNIEWTDPTDKNSSRKISMRKYREGTGQTEMTPIIVTEPDNVTHLVSLDLNAMTLEGLPFPAGSGGMFDPMPDPHESPDTSTDDSEDEEGSL